MNASRLVYAVFAFVMLASAWAVPVSAQDIDPANPPPWPTGRIPPDGMPSRLDKAPIPDVLAAYDTQTVEGVEVFKRRKNDPDVLAWATAEAARNNGRAMVLLGDFKRDAAPAEAISLYKAAAEGGDPVAMRKMADIYAEGAGVENNYAEAMRLWNLAAEKGDKGAMLSLANAYRAGVMVPRDVEAAQRWVARYSGSGAALITSGPPPGPWRVDTAALEAKALSGDVTAMRRLGLAYATGDGATPDGAAAFRWYSMGAGAQDAGSITGLGSLYQRGFGAPKDTAKAVALFETAAAKGDRGAMKALSDAYRTGTGVNTDPGKARTWLYRWFWAP